MEEELLMIVYESQQIGQRIEHCLNFPSVAITAHFSFARALSTVTAPWLFYRISVSWMEVHSHQTHAEYTSDNIGAQYMHSGSDSSR